MGKHDPDAQRLYSYSLPSYTWCKLYLNLLPLCCNKGRTSGNIERCGVHVNTCFCVLTPFSTPFQNNFSPAFNVIKRVWGSRKAGGEASINHYIFTGPIANGILGLAQTYMYLSTTTLLHTHFSLCQTRVIHQFACHVLCSLQRPQAGHCRERPFHSLISSEEHQRDSEVPTPSTPWSRCRAGGYYCDESYHQNHQRWRGKILWQCRHSPLFLVEESHKLSDTPTAPP